mmetsp:Transcript_24128/g.78541  ORF Transcript_24128/g.78541 Transcript_24128/m.78541 type:complete len:388 (-) Transcript_24128:4125-5288(-)
MSLIQRGLVFSQIEYDYVSMKNVKNISLDSKILYLNNRLNHLLSNDKKFNYILIENNKHSSIFWALINIRTPIVYYFSYPFEIISNKLLINKENKFEFSNNIKKINTQITGLDINILGTILALGDYKGILFLWSSTSKKLLDLNLNDGPLIIVKWSENSKLLMIYGVPNNIYIISNYFYKCICKIKLSLEICDKILWFSNCEFLTISNERIINFIDLMNNGYLKQILNFNRINKINFHSYKNILALLSNSIVVILLKNQKLEYFLSIKEKNEEIVNIEWIFQIFSNNLNDLVIAIIKRNNLSVFDLLTRKKSHSLLFNDIIQNLNVSQEGNVANLSIGSNFLRIFKFSTIQKSLNIEFLHNKNKVQILDNPLNFRLLINDYRNLIFF